MDGVLWIPPHRTCQIRLVIGVSSYPDGMVSFMEAFRGILRRSCRLALLESKDVDGWSANIITLPLLTGVLVQLRVTGRVLGVEIGVSTGILKCN